MSLARHFLDWDGPALPKTAAWLVDKFGHDLAGVVVVTPGARAGRRLLELLVEMTAGRPLSPPDFVTAGALPERLYSPDQPVADDLLALLAWTDILRNAKEQIIQCVVPHPPDRNDHPAWWSLAEQLAQLRSQLAAECVRIDQVAPRCAEASPDFPDAERWHAIASLDAAYASRLRDRKLIDKHTARLSATCRTDRSIVLVGAADLNRVTLAMLEQVADSVTVLIHAPESEADGFDALGCFNADYWAVRPLNLDRDTVVVVDRPRDQATAALRVIADASQHTADEITIGLGDEALGPMLRRTLDLARVPARLPTGRAVSQTAPALLLATLSRFAQRRRLDDLAAALRHPDVEQYADRDALDLPLLDQYATDHLQAEITERWLTRRDEQVTPLNRLYQAVDDLLPDDGLRALPQWCEPIAAALKKVYADRDLDPAGDAAQGLAAIGDALRELAALDAGDALTPQVSFAQAVQLALSRADGHTTPHDPPGAAVEMLGWLELQLDDAPLLIVTGVNEGKLPRSTGADVFLPDGIRASLGLPDSAHVFARDRMMLEAILRSRQRVQLISGRRGANDDPLTPSRLLLACDEDRLAPWVRAFYGSDESPSAAPILIAPGKSAFAIPVPQPPAQPLTSLRVTAFRDYIACPYRFYLRHVLKLTAMDDRAVEMNAMAFGNLAHTVLQAFGRDDARDLEGAEKIQTYLSAQLDRELRRQYGAKPRAAVMIQTELLRRRLASFAAWQAKQVAAGWRIDPQLVEEDWRTELPVDDDPFTITGRIDRIDHHPDFGYRILDYKTGDNAKAPDDNHRAKDDDGSLGWIDLQLPLYRTLAAAQIGDAPVQLGYVNLPKALAQTNLYPAEWSDDELGEARDTAVNIVRDIRNGVFWAPNDPPQYADGFEAICMDASPDREAIIDEVTP